MNTQEAFDKIYAATRTQRSRATSLNGSCTFLAPNGNRCFLGMLMTAEQALRATDDNWNVRRVVDEVGFSGSCSTLLDLMSVHDGTEPAAWDDELKKLAERHVGVVYPPKDPT